MRKLFNQLDYLLKEHADHWRVSPFTSSQSVWRDDYPELFHWLMALSDAEVDQLQGDDLALCRQFMPYYPPAKEISQLILFPLSPAKVVSSTTHQWQRDIPGRKADQIAAFCSALGEPSGPVVEWCCGKLHLGRYLAEHYSSPVLGLEVNNELVAQGNRLIKRTLSSHDSLAQAHRHNAEVVQCDVLGDQVADHLDHHKHAVALHACGGLHVQLLKMGIQQRVQRVSVAPCCYHRFNNSADYQPLSQPAQKSTLKLTMDDLRSAVRQTNTAPNRDRAQRKKMQAWRLGLDSLQRNLRGVDEYLPVPSLPISLLGGSFGGFCEHVALLKGLTIPAGTSFSHYEQRGAVRFFEYSRCELLRMVFRRALETWLVLDRAVYLEEQGYDCQVTQFCESALTPRNLFIDAVRRA